MIKVIGQRSKDDNERAREKSDVSNFSLLDPCLGEDDCMLRKKYKVEVDGVLELLLMFANISNI